MQSSRGKPLSCVELHPMQCRVLSLFREQLGVRAEIGRAHV